MKRRLTALIPAHNDDYILSLCLHSIVDHFDEIVVLDDCSSDHTSDVVLDAASRCRHVRLIRHEGRQLGWIEARNRLLAAIPRLRDWLFWLDADDVLCEYSAHLLRRIAEGPEPVVRLQLCELWGDFAHTTGRLRHYDRCHVFVNRARLGRPTWYGGCAANIRSARDPARRSPAARDEGGGWTAARGPGPLLFHCKGVKPDRRLVERAFTRAWLRAGAPGRLEDFAGLAAMSAEELHRRALRILLRSKQDRIRRLPAPSATLGTGPSTTLGTGPSATLGTGFAPRLPAVLRAERRFEMVYRDGAPCDRLDHGWAPPEGVP